MTEKFQAVLDNGEDIVLSYTPNKKKVYFGNLFLMGLMLLFVCGFIALALFIPDEGLEPAKPIAVLIPIGIFIVVELITLLFTKLWLNNTFFAVTNKRILIRTGIIGVDYKSLDLKTIGATNVYVSVIDKILGGKTGSIRFGSMSSPMNNNAVMYNFSNIVSPYETYKVIKELIETAKQN